jgi:hypothetical protein
MSKPKRKRNAAKPKRKPTAAERRARRERKRKYMTIFINGRQKRVRRPDTIDGLPVEEFIARNADPIWLHQNELWELMTPDDESIPFSDDESIPFSDDESIPFSDDESIPF